MTRLETSWGWFGGPRSRRQAGWLALVWLLTLVYTLVYRPTDDLMIALAAFGLGSNGQQALSKAKE
jgi:hypothetical protein